MNIKWPLKQRVQSVDLEHAVTAGVDEWLVDAKFSIANELLSVQTVAPDKSKQRSHLFRPSIRYVNSKIIILKNYKSTQHVQLRSRLI